jgi:hypothetical protein
VLSGFHLLFFAFSYFEFLLLSGFPPLADLSKLVLSWKHRASPVTVSVSSCTTTTDNYSSSVTAAAADRKKKKQGLTVSECLKRRKETDQLNNGLGTSSVDSSSGTTHLANDSSSLGSASTELTKLSFVTDCPATVSSPVQHCKEGPAQVESTLHDSSNLRTVTVSEADGEPVIKLTDGNCEESVFLSELIADRAPLISDKLDVAEDDVITGEQINGREHAHSKNVEHSGESWHTDVARVIRIKSKSITPTKAVTSEVNSAESIIEAKCNETDSLVCESSQTPLESEQYLLTHSNDTQNSNVTDLTDVQLCSVSNDNSSSVTVKTSTSCVESSTAASVVRSCWTSQPSSTILLQAGTTASHVPSMNQVALKNSGERVFLNLNVDNSVLGSGLVYGKFIYHNGQLVLSHSKTANAVSGMQSLLPENVHTVVYSPASGSTSIFLPPTQVIPVYSVQPAPSLLTIARVMPDVTILTPAPQNVVTSLDVNWLRTEHNRSPLAPVKAPAETLSSTAECDSHKGGESLSAVSPSDNSFFARTEAKCLDVILNDVATSSATSTGDTVSVPHTQVATEIVDGETMDKNYASPVLETADRCLLTSDECVLRLQSSAESDSVLGISSLTAHSCNVSDGNGENIGKNITSVSSSADVSELPLNCAEHIGITADSKCPDVMSSGQAEISSVMASSTAALCPPGDASRTETADQRTSVALLPNDDAGLCNDTAVAEPAQDAVHVAFNDLPEGSRASSAISCILAVTENPAVETCVQTSLNTCDSRAGSATVVSSLVCSYSTAKDSALSKCTERFAASPSWSSSVLTYPLSSVPRTASYDTSEYLAFPIFGTPEVNDGQRGIKRKSSTSCYQKASKSRKINCDKFFNGSISRYICPPPDSAVEKDRCLEIFVLDQLNAGGRTANIDCTSNGFEDLITVEQSADGCRSDVGACATEISNSLSSAVPVVDEFWRPDADSSSVMQISATRDKTELMTVQAATPAVGTSATVVNDGARAPKFSSGTANSCFTAYVSQEPVASAIANKSDRTAVSSARNKSFALASFLPTSQTSTSHCSTLSSVETMGAAKSPKTSEITYSFLAEYGLPCQNSYIHMPKNFGSVLSADAFASSDDISLTDTELSVLLNDADVFTAPSAKTTDTSGPFWNAGIGISNSKTREKGKDMSSQFYKPDGGIPVMHNFGGDSHRMDWHMGSSDRADIGYSANGKSCFDVSTLTGRVSSGNYSLWSVPYNIDQQHASHFPVHQMPSSAPIPFESFNVAASQQCQVADPVFSNTPASLCSVSTTSEQTASSSREIFSLARHAVPSRATSSSALTSCSAPDTCSASVNSFWSPCASSSYSVASNRTTALHSPSFQYKGTHTAPGTWSKKDSVNSSSSKQSLLGLRLSSNNQGFEQNYHASDPVMSNLYIDRHRTWMPATAQQSALAADATQSAAASLSFRPQIEIENVNNSCRWSEEEFYPFSSARKKTAVQNAANGRSCGMISSAVQPSYQVITSIASTSSSVSTSTGLNSRGQQVMHSDDGSMLTDALYSLTSDAQCSSTASFGFPIAFSQPASTPVSCHKLPPFSFSAVPPIPDFIFNFPPPVSIQSVPSYSSGQTTMSGSQWSLGTSMQLPNASKQQLTFPISSQLTSFEQSNSLSNDCIAKRLSPNADIRNKRKPCAKSEFNSSFLCTTKDSVASSTTSASVCSLPFAVSSAVVHPQQQNIVVGSSNCLVSAAAAAACSSQSVDVRSYAFSGRSTGVTDNCLTSPPLHHPPVTSSCSTDAGSGKQLKLSTSFAIPSLTLAPPMLTLSAPHAFQPAPPLIGIVPSDVYGGISWEAADSSGNSLPETTHLRVQEFIIPPHGAVDSQHLPRANASKRASKFMKLSPKHAADGCKVPLPTYGHHQNGELRQPVSREMPTYLSNAPFVHGGLAESSLHTNLERNDCQISVSINPVFAPTVPNSLSLNTFGFQSTSAATTLHVATSHGHLHNFGFGSIFSDLTSSPSVIAPPPSIGGLRLHPAGPVNFLPISDSSAHQQHHHRSSNSQPFSTRVTQSSSMHNMSINSLLGREQRALPQNQFSSASDVMNSSHVSQFGSSSFDFPVYNHHL